jgi:hypothetical protein
MSKNLSDIFPPTEIGGGGGGGIEEAPRDGRMYARQEQLNTGMGWTAFDPGNLDPGTEDDQVLLWHTADDKWSASNTVPAVQSGPTPPFNPVEGTLWMEVPNQGDATMWVYTKDSGGNGRWLQHPGGKDGAPGADGNIADATEQGVIATWDNTSQQWTPEGGVVVDASGRVGIGTDSPGDKLELYDDSSPVYIRQTRGVTNPVEQIMGPTGSTASSVGQIGTTSDHGFRMVTGNTERMRIDADGNATFSAGAEIKAAEHDTVASLTGAITFPRVSGNIPDFAALFGAEDGRLGVAAREGIKFYTGGGNQYQQTLERMYIDTNGKTTFVSGNQLDRGLSISGGTANGMADSAWTISADAQNSGSQIIFKTRGTECMKLSENGRVDITGSLYVNNVPKIGTSELIETLSTLREATKDETTIKGLRDAIGNAVGGLIEKFEAMQSTATQEISDE